MSDCTIEDPVEVKSETVGKGADKSVCFSRARNFILNALRKEKGKNDMDRKMPVLLCSSYVETLQCGPANPNKRVATRVYSYLGHP